jgi:hypothetical protein
MDKEVNQLLLDAERQYTQLKQRYEEISDSFLQRCEADCDDLPTLVKAFWQWHAAGTALFNAAEKFLPIEALSGADRTPEVFAYWSETCVDLLDAIANHYATAKYKADHFSIAEALLMPSSKAFAGIQRRAKLFSPDEAAELRSRFAALGLPTYGFDNEGVQKPGTSRAVVSADKPHMMNVTNVINGPAVNWAIGENASAVAGEIVFGDKGDRIMRDNISIGHDAIGSAVGTNASVKARDIVTDTTTQSGLDEDLMKRFDKALVMIKEAKLEPGKEEDVTDDVNKLKREMAKPTKDHGRIQTLLDRIRATVPSVADLLSMAASITSLVSGS